MEGSFAFGKANKSLYNFFTNLIFLYRLINKVPLVPNSEVEKVDVFKLLRIWKFCIIEAIATIPQTISFSPIHHKNRVYEHEHN